MKELENFDFFPFGNPERPLEEVSEAAFERLSFTFTREHLEGIARLSLAPGASENDRYVCACILRNAQVAAEGKFPLCQDTGIATAFGWRGRGYVSAENEFEAVSEGARRVYGGRRLRFSTSVPSGFFDEFDPKDNSPAQVAIFCADSCLAPLPPFVRGLPDDAMGMVFCAKGGGSSNKTCFIQGTKADLNPEKFTELMREQISRFGTSACPPYTIAVVAGGLSPEQNLLALKLATAGAYDGMTEEPNAFGFRDREIEELAMKIASETGFGAQFGGRSFALSAVAVRLPRHGASCPISFGVSCSAHRNLKAVVTGAGFYLERTVRNPEAEIGGFSEAVKFAETERITEPKSGLGGNSTELKSDKNSVELKSNENSTELTPDRNSVEPKFNENSTELKADENSMKSKFSGNSTEPKGDRNSAEPRGVREVSTDGGIESVLRQLKGARPGERVVLSGKILVARDAAHARWKAAVDAGNPLPDYTKKYPICYAGPARTPDGAAIGSFGPTTAGRMDVYAQFLMERGAALVTLAKGNRSARWTEACGKFGAFYLGTPGGIAALIASKYIKAQEIVDYEDLGMEAVRLVDVRSLPCFVVTNGDGEDFYENLRGKM